MCRAAHTTAILSSASEKMTGLVAYDDGGDSDEGDADLDELAATIKKRAVQDDDDDDDMFAMTMPAKRPGLKRTIVRTEPEPTTTSNSSNTSNSNNSDVHDDNNSNASKTPAQDTPGEETRKRRLDDDSPLPDAKRSSS